jgi:hypothetical protein
MLRLPSLKLPSWSCDAFDLVVESVAAWVVRAASVADAVVVVAVVVVVLAEVNACVVIRVVAASVVSVEVAAEAGVIGLVAVMMLSRWLLLRCRGRVAEIHP